MANKIKIFLLCSVFIFLLCGCSKDNNESMSSNNSSDNNAIDNTTEEVITEAEKEYADEKAVQAIGEALERRWGLIEENANASLDDCVN